MGLKYLNHIIRFSLVAFIALSFYLSYLIWVSPARSEDNTGPEVSQNLVDKRSEKELFLPTSLSFYDDKKLYVTNSQELLLHLHQKMKKQEIRRLQWYDFDNEELLNKSLVKTDYISFDYFAPMKLNQYLNVYQFQLSEKDKSRLKTAYFDEVRVNILQKQLVFINHETHQVIKFHIQMDVSALAKYLLKHKKQMNSYDGQTLLVSGQVYSHQPIQLQLYSYISTAQPYTLFRDAFFGDIRDIKVNDDTKDELVLSNHQGDMLTIYLNSQLIEFRANQVDFHNKNMYQVSADYISRLGTNLGQLRFFNRDAQGIVYRSFVEGYPLFRKDENGELHVHFGELSQDNTRNMEIRGSLNTIQVPIPSEKTVKLPGGLTIYEKLQAAGLKEIPEMTIGYLWVDIQDTGVVDLTPTWFVHYENTWVAFDELMNELLQKKGA